MTHGVPSLRLDVALVERGLAPTRARARDLILRGEVTVDGVVALKPAAGIAAASSLAITTDANVPRGALKLRAGLDAFAFGIAGRVCLDIGASTGGFTHVLLERGAARVYAVDVGHGQLAAALKADERVLSLEGQDARSLTRAQIPEPVGGIVVDVSFISLTKVLPVPLSLAARGAWLVALIKPQFEVGRDGIGKGGIVRDSALRDQAVADVRQWIASQAPWQVVDVVPSPITGGSGNVEFLLGARRHD